MATKNEPTLAYVINAKEEAIEENNELYNNMATNAGEYYDDMADAVKAHEKVQKKNQQAATDFAIREIKQQKDQAKSDYLKEQSSAYTDWQKQSGAYGVNAEQMAASGLRNTGYSESSQVSMYNQYQNRVAVARESYQRAVLNYDNAITEARLQNNAALAEIAYQSLMKQLELAIEGFQYKNTLIIDKADQNLAITQTYNQQYQDVLQHIYQEDALAETKRHNEATLAENKRQFNAQMSLEQAKFAFQKQQASSTGSASTRSSGSSGSKKSSTKSTKKASKTYISNGKKSTSNSGVKAVNKDEKLTVDMKSVLNLGYGPISAAKLNSLIKKGTVQEYKSNGKLKYRKVFKR